MNYGDSIQETISGTSTSVITLGGVGYGATSGSRTFATAVGLGDIGLLPDTPLRVADDAGNWLTGWFTLSAPGGVYTLTRNRIKSSSNSNGNVVLGGTVRKVSNVPLADQFQIGMVNPDDVGFDGILLIGQSNMQGAGVRDAKIDVVDSRIFQFGCLASDTTYYQKIHQAADPLAMPVGGTDLGPGMPFARTYAAMTPTNRRVLLLPLAVGSTGLVGGTWASGTPGGALYESAISQALLAVTAAQAMYPNSRIVGFAWIQGEGDGDGAQSQAAYATALKAMIAGFRARLSVPDAWFIIGGMVPEGITSHANYQPINAAHIQVANETDHCTFVAGPTGLDGGSALHYNAAGIRLHGAHMALAVPAAKAFTATDVSAPVQAGAVVANAAPTLVDITMTEAMNTNFTPAASTVTISGHTVSALAWASATVLRATVTAAFVNGEAASTAAYTANGTNNARDLAGNLLANFSGYAIANNVQPVASTVTVAVSASSGAVGAPVTVTIGTNYPLTGAQSESVAVTSNVAGPFATSPVTLNASTPTATLTFTPSATGTATITGTATGSPTLSNGTTSYTVTATDSTAPILSSPTGTQTGPTTANGTVTTDEANGTLYALASINTTETAATVKASANTQAITTTGIKNVSVTGLTTGTTYYWHYIHRDAAGNDSGVAHSAGFTPAAVAVLRLTSLGAGIAESGTSPNFVYTGTANNGYGSTTGQGRSSMKFVGDGSMTFQLGGAGIDHAGDWMIGFTTSATVVAYTAWSNGVWSTATPGGNYKTLTTGGTQGSTSTPNANGDFIRITRTGTTLTFDVARMATPTTWINLSTATGVSTADSYVWATPTNTGEMMQNLSGSGLV